MKDAFIVTRDDRSKMEFEPSEIGLHHYDFNLRTRTRVTQDWKIMLIQTVERIQRNSTEREIEL